MILAHAGLSGWEWHAHPDVWALIAVLGGAYWLALSRLGPSRVQPGEPVAARRQVALFCAGLGALWLHADWPVHDIGEHYLFSVHMFQHIGFTLIAAPLLLLGLPVWLVRTMVRARPVRWVVSRLARPLPAAVVFNLVTVLTHWPLVVEASVRNHPLHFLVHVVIFTSAVLMWFPVLNRVPELPRIRSDAARGLYVFLQSVIPTIPASFLTFGEGLLYPFYGEAPRPFPLSALEDQRTAGALMKVYAGLLLWSVILVIFFRWYDRDQKQAAAGVLTWEQVERELAQTEPAPKEPAAPTPPTP
ncbi:MAG: cytochrome c oxidase assembly protein [Acidimicrobiales bacterium]